MRVLESLPLSGFARFRCDVHPASTARSIIEGIQQRDCVFAAVAASRLAVAILAALLITLHLLIAALAAAAVSRQQSRSVTAASEAP